VPKLGERCRIDRLGRHEREQHRDVGRDAERRTDIEAFPVPLFRTFDVAVDFTSITEWSTTDDPSAEWDTAASSWLPVRWRHDRFNDAAHLPSS
jgi:hypothetical protein